MRNRTARVLQTVLPPSVVVGRVPLPAGDRRVALSFDDGPEPMTPPYLDALDQLGIPATFFVLGRLCQQFPQHLRDMVRRGHEVASHGFSHRRFTLMTHGELVRELTRVDRLLPPTTRARPLVRPPGGDVTTRSLSLCALHGYTTALWSVNSEDFRAKDPEHIARCAIPDDIRPGDVVLLHEGQEWTLAALPLIQRRAHERGFALCTISDLLAGPATPSA